MHLFVRYSRQADLMPDRNMSCLRRCLLGVMAAAIVVLALLTAMLAFAASWLLQADELQSAEAIVILAGDARRTRHAADLFRQGLAPRVLVSRPVRTARERLLDGLGIPFPLAEQLDFEVLRKTGVPAANIAFYGDGSVSTFDEALALQRLFAGKTPRLVVVTSPYHVRRARMILVDAMPGADLRVVATPYEEFPERWWTSQDAARDLLLEMAKLGFYLVGGRFSTLAR
jgi:uncharacterized SAM-binding protein YcdF (DUF218 family)